MSYKNTNVRGAGITEAQEVALFAQMRSHGAAEEHAYRSMSGADVSGAPMHGIMRRFFALLWEGLDVETALADCEARWRSYADENNAKVKAAPKVKRGPMSGHSVISYRWTDPERFASHEVHLRTMAKMILAPGGREHESAGPHE